MTNKVIITYGRYNPPTIGHQLCFAFAKNLANKQNADYIAWVSHSVDDKCNPLDLAYKLRLLHLIEPTVKFIATDNNIKNIVLILEQLNDTYTDLTLVVGDDRVAKFRDVVLKYNGVKYDYDALSVVSAGVRLDYSNILAETASASKARNDVINQDYDSFKMCIPTALNNEIILELWNELKMKICK